MKFYSGVVLVDDTGTSNYAEETTLLIQPTHVVCIYAWRRWHLLVGVWRLIISEQGGQAAGRLPRRQTDKSVGRHSRQNILIKKHFSLIVVQVSGIIAKL